MRALNRRAFLKCTAAALAAPTLIRSSALGADDQPAPSNRIVMAAIGLGGMGKGNMSSFMHMKEVQMVAVCDVDKEARDEAKEEVDKYYAQQVKDGSYKGCATYNDFRELLARDDIDAVAISTPDHWHAIISIEAAKSGKDIYCEKPLSLTIREARAMVNAVRRYGRVFQTG
ncbi:MAG: Gfo/Idh/MocA family oxidoreductase, partial [Planctomycetes bacterium]|nr:Gfo/Idh/MocA family oxidoreductase [Planctomycetota bacterium]